VSSAISCDDFRGTNQNVSKIRINDHDGDTTLEQSVIIKDDQRIVDRAGNKKSTDMSNNYARRKVFERKWSFATQAEDVGVFW